VLGLTPGAFATLQGSDGLMDLTPLLYKHGDLGRAGAHRDDAALHRPALGQRLPPCARRAGRGRCGHGHHAPPRGRACGAHNSIPGLVAAALFAFVTSWNEVSVATILTQQNTTLPAQVVSELASSPLPFRFAGGFALMVPAFVFIFFMRPYRFTAFRGVGAH